MLFDADFADLFEVKDDLTKTGELYRQREHDGVTLGYQRERLPPGDLHPRAGTPSSPRSR